MVNRAVDYINYERYVAWARKVPQSKTLKTK